MKHKGTQQLQTQRLCLRRFTHDDAQAMFNNWASDPVVTHYLTWLPHEDITVTQKVLSDWIEQYAYNNFYQWAITLNTHQEEPIGTISVVNHNDITQELEIGYCLSQAYWGVGIMSEALIAVREFLCEEVHVTSLVSHHDVANTGSGKVLINGGFQYESTKEQSDYNNQGCVDSHYYRYKNMLK